MSTPPFLTLPPGVSRVDIETARGTFAALEALPGSAAPDRRTALLAPGFTGSKEDFIAVLATLTAAGRRVIAVDQRGQYETSGPEDPEAYTLAALGADLVALLAALHPAGEPVHVVGHSFGGLVAREAGIANPSLLASVTLMSSGPAAVGDPGATRARALVEALQSIELKDIWDGYLGPEAVSAGHAPEIVDFLRTRMLSNTPAALIGMGRELTTAPDRVDQLAKVIGDDGPPALVVYGENDDAWPPSLQAAMADRLAARTVVIPGAAHSPAVEAPEATASALAAFWDDAEAAR
ncbi:MAG TPA: alpha/beta fold hydrolase [Streptosporangiaceae bacterium]